MSLQVVSEAKEGKLTLRGAERLANEGLPRWVDELLKLKEEASEELSKGLEASWACRILDHLKIPRPGKEGPLGKIRREAPGDAGGRNYD